LSKSERKKKGQNERGKRKERKGEEDQASKNGSRDGKWDSYRQVFRGLQYDTMFCTTRY